jgi:FkbM family methyltransferase
MLRDNFIDIAMKLGVDEHLRTLRSTIVPRYRQARVENEHMRKLLRSVLKSDSHCIDIGAYRGRILGELVRLAPRGRHIAYEPLPHLHKLVHERFPMVDVRQAAVSDEVGETIFHYVKSTPAESGLRERSYSVERQIEKLVVRTETLDSCLPEGYVPTFIKIDVEGAELQVFRGGIEMITRHKPVIIFEHGKGGATYYNTQPGDVYSLLAEEIGLSIFDLEGNGPYSKAQFEDAFAEDRRWDYVARPWR